MNIDPYVLLCFGISFAHMLIIYFLYDEKLDLQPYFSILARYLGLYASILTFLFLFGIRDLSKSYQQTLIGIGAVTILWLSIKDLFVELFRVKNKL